MLRLTVEEWISVENISNILSHFAKQTTRLQSEMISLSDFFGAWARIKMELSKYGNDLLAQNLLNQMKRRETVLFNNDVLNAAVFLDPRFQKFMPNDKKEAAIIFLSNLHKRIESVKHESVDINIPDDSSADELEAFLNDMYGSEEASNNNSRSTERAPIDITTILKNFIGEKETLNTSIFDYWKKNMYAKPDLYTLAAVIHAVPPTQTTIERAFSAMALVLTHLRSNLSDKNLENILLVRLNRDIFEEMCAQ